MSDLTTVDNPLGNFGNSFEVSKIVDYKLDQDVMEMYLQGFKTSRIVKRCNEILDARKDDKEYAELNYMNVKNFLITKQKEIELSKVDDLTPLSRKAIDISEKLQEILHVIETELDKLRNPDAPVLDSKQELFIRLIKEFNKTLELAAGIQGKIQPSITFNIFQSNVEKFCKKIADCKQFTDETKSLMLNMAADELITDSLLKPIDGKEIK